MAGARDGRSVLRGLTRLALLRADGIAEFGGTTQAFLNSLAPLSAFALVAGFLGVAGGEAQDALTELLITAVALLTPPVLSHALALRWGRTGAWTRYATAFNWCHWLVLFAFAVFVLIGTGMLVGAGVPAQAALIVAELAWVAYGLSLHWLLARRGLGIGRWRTAVLLVLVEFGTGLLVVVPLLARRAFS
ncbi:MAG TPA: hypothetical protein VHS58_03240 [Acetobacteraceae bacterium]|jgi:hypothetical protein|nr:hypothetical protein [Acetobacteraceae bacterium]